MHLKNTILAVCVSSTLFACGGKYAGIQIDKEDVHGYVNAYNAFNANYQDFLRYINSVSKPDSTQINKYDEIMYILNIQGFPDVDYFYMVNTKLKPYLEAIMENPNVERYPGIGTADLSFIEEGEKQYRKFLEDSTLSAKDKEFFRKQMAQIETTKVDLFDKQEKNRIWVQIVRKQATKYTDVELSDLEIMQLTALAGEIERLE
ncbi:MAG: hypothetical protein K5685_03575 [Bacteroidales bacterium]|nr:hypothetical protein [Bacteroidales bacterium]